MKVVDEIVKEEVKKIDEFNQTLSLGFWQFKKIDKMKRIAETENQIRNKLRQKHEQHHYQSSVTL